MAATIVATAGSASANSYCLLTEAEAFCDTHPYTEAWDAASADMRKRAIITATRLIDQRIEWSGHATDTTQALAWPRVGMVNRNYVAIDEDVVPTDLKNATADFARIMLEHDYTADNAAGRDGLSRVKAGPVEIDYRDAGLAGKMIPDSVWSMLEIWGQVRERSSGMATLSRS